MNFHKLRFVQIQNEANRIRIEMEIVEKPLWHFVLQMRMESQ